MLFQVFEETSNAKAESSIQTKDQSSTTISSIFSSINQAGQKYTNSTTTSTTSSSSNLTTQKEGPLFSISSVRPYNQKTTVRTQRYSDASEKDKKLPPLPAKPTIIITDYSRGNKVHRENQIPRSTSTRELRSQNQRERLKPFVVGD